MRGIAKDRKRHTFSGTEVHRFARDEHDGGDATGWRLDVGWFRRVSGLQWAWFSREVNDAAT
jgi:hypothetical protein